MWSIVFCLLMYQEPVVTKTVVLETRGELFPDPRPTRLKHAFDNSWIVANNHSVWHFNPDGSLRLTFGGEGQGPNEYKYITTLHWNGEFYWVVDGRGGKLTKIDENGEYISRTGAMLQNLEPLLGKTWALVMDEIGSKENMQPLVFQEVDLVEGYQKSPRRFHRLSKEVVDLGYNFKGHFIVTDGDLLYILDQLSPDLKAYDPMTYQLAKTFTLRIPGFSQSPTKFFNTRAGTQKEFADWWFSFSRFIGMRKLDSGFAVAFTAPDPESEKTGLVTICKVDNHGKNPRVKTIPESHVLGSLGDEFLIFTAKDEDEQDDLVYAVDFYAWQ